MKIKLIAIAIIAIGIIWSMSASETRRRATAACVDRGVAHYQKAGQFPYVYEGLVRYYSRDIAVARCGKNPDAF